MRILIVGAGAVGQVYGLYLQRAGAEVAVYVREKYRAGAEAGFTLYPLHRGTPPQAERFLPSAVCARPEEATAAGPWDQLWLAVSSVAVRGGWLGPLIEAAQPRFVVGLQPGPEERDFLLQHIPAERAVFGGIGMISYQAPLPGDPQAATPSEPTSQP